MDGCVALVVAAGRGVRFGGEVPKQYRRLAGQPLLRRALAAFAGHPEVAAVRPVIHDDDRALFAETARGLDLLDPVTGGASRQESVRLGLESLVAAPPRGVLIHDAARPLVGRALISRVVAALDGAAGAVPAVPVSDTLKRARDGRIEATVERGGLWRAQTPQGFRFADILDAHRRFAGAEATDDAQLAERAGLAVAVVPGDEENIKITTEDDLARAERILGSGVTRTGSGFDAHRFGPGDHVTLGGVAIPFERGLVGHSDADVALHALTDAILGAIGAGDIGVHFPASDARWRGASSHIFLRHAADLVALAGGSIVHVDVTVICERPRISAHRVAMVRRIAEILSLPGDAVSVKGTTTEGLGFTGRGEGIAAQAVATVRLLP